MSAHQSTPILTTMLNKFYNEYLVNTLTSVHNTTPNATEEVILSAVYYGLYGGHGIRRKIIADNAVMLNYQKKHNKYDRNNMLSNLFRSVIINPKTMAITSMGLPQSEALTDDIRAQMQAMESPSFPMFYRCETFDIGTMIIFNKDRTYTYTLHDNDDDTDEQVTLDASISTRSKIGTGSYNTDMTHRYYFEKNNMTDPTNIIDLSKIPDDMKSVTLVFNMRNEAEHVGRISDNSLVGAFQMPTDEAALQANWNAIITLVQSATTASSESFDAALRQLLKRHFELAHVTMLNVLNVQQRLISAGVGTFKLPMQLNLNSLAEVEEYVSKQQFHEQGVMIWLPNCSRTKLRNPQFTYVRNLCYNHPINPSPLNQKNLFKIFWNLQLENKVPEFFKYYETSDFKYNFIFNYFHTRIFQFANYLFQTYHELHVLKRLQGDKVPKFLKPLCYELHGKYLANKEPITREKVMLFIRDMEVWALYGRLFTPIF
jgi:hypothetical protein